MEGADGSSRPKSLPVNVQLIGGTILIRVKLDAVDDAHDACSAGEGSKTEDKG